MECLERCGDGTENLEIYDYHKSTKITSHFYRTKIVIMKLEGKKNSEIARAMNVGEKTVRKWIARYTAKGIQGLLEA